MSLRAAYEKPSVKSTGSESWKLLDFRSSNGLGRANYQALDKDHNKSTGLLVSNILYPYSSSLLSKVKAGKSLQPSDWTNLYIPPWRKQEEPEMAATAFTSEHLKVLRVQIKQARRMPGAIPGSSSNPYKTLVYMVKALKMLRKKAKEWLAHSSPPIVPLALPSIGDLSVH
ncbi:hypothetical protein FOA52_008061 [Chlamydomonas sp. UWO 241]|nr:hypothetical protein FOA52_008061 [Chlamydomonas sp. UWO 241]